jgi:hypothetical protein
MSAQSNNGMHPTADTPALILGNVAGRRVMPGVRLLERSGITADGMSSRGGWRGSPLGAPPAMMNGLTPSRADGGGPGAGWESSPTLRATEVALKVDAI